MFHNSKKLNSFSFGIMFLHNDDKHYGSKTDRIYYPKIWERTADWLGGVNRNNYHPFWSWRNFVPW